MHLDTQTTLFASASIAFAISVAVFFYSIVRVENRSFIWAAMASGGLAVSQFLVGFRGRIPDFFSIIVANELVIFCLVAFFEVIRRLLSSRPKEIFVGPVLLVIQFFFFIWFTYYEPDFPTRVFLISCSFCIMSSIIIKLFIMETQKEQRLFYISASIPFILLFLISIIRILSFLWGNEISEFSYNSPAYSYFSVFYGIASAWIPLSLVFIVNHRLQTKVIELARTDPLTGALNRRALHDVAKQEIARANRSDLPLSLIIIDLDHFKLINDTFGHHAGDAILTHIVTLFKKVLRAGDTLARYGGEEFVVLLPGADIKTTVSIAERLRKTCKTNPLVFENKPLTVTLSLGISGFTHQCLDYEALIKQADVALYTAKKEGRDRVVVFQG